MIEWLVGQGKTEAASVVAGIFSEHVDHKLKFLTAASKSVNIYNYILGILVYCLIRPYNLNGGDSGFNI